LSIYFLRSFEWRGAIDRGEMEVEGVEWVRAEELCGKAVEK
jgi:hypothetical protein